MDVCLAVVAFFFNYNTRNDHHACNNRNTFSIFIVASNKGCAITYWGIKQNACMESICMPLICHYNGIDRDDVTWRVTWNSKNCGDYSTIVNCFCFCFCCCWRGGFSALSRAALVCCDVGSTATILALAPRTHQRMLPQYARSSSETTHDTKNVKGVRSTKDC